MLVDGKIWMDSYDESYFLARIVRTRKMAMNYKRFLHGGETTVPVEIRLLPSKPRHSSPKKANKAK